MFACLENEFNFRSTANIFGQKRKFLSNRRVEKSDYTQIWKQIWKTLLLEFYFIFVCPALNN